MINYPPSKIKMQALPAFLLSGYDCILRHSGGTFLHIPSNKTLLVTKNGLTMEATFILKKEFIICYRADSLKKGQNRYCAILFDR